MANTGRKPTSTRFGVAGTLASAVWLFVGLGWTSGAKGDFVIGITPTTVGPITAGQGGTFEITLTATAPHTNLLGYNATFNVASHPDVVMSAVDAVSTTTGGYVFPGDAGSVQLNDLGGGSYDVNNLYSNAAFPNLTVGLVYSLGRVQFTTSGSASGSYAVTFDSIVSAFVDDQNNPIPATFGGGTIMVLAGPSAVPEPSSWIFGLLAAAVGGASALKRQRRRPTGLD